MAEMFLSIEIVESRARGLFFIPSYMFHAVGRTQRSEGINLRRLTDDGHCQRPRILRHIKNQRLGNTELIQQRFANEASLRGRVFLIRVCSRAAGANKKNDRAE